jgi:ring-1,2-phenylacetyl-CoA epoxidase subunit PaaD
MTTTTTVPADRPAAAEPGARPALGMIWRTLAAIPDPEIPVISIVELGIVRGVEWRGEELVVIVTPTYSGCPATELIAADIERAIASTGVGRCRVETRLAPAWTTDWIAPEAKERLAQFGIAPPGQRASEAARIMIHRSVRSRDRAGLGATLAQVACPRCGSTRTRELSRFGSTPCKAQYRCEDCLEPFDYFKPH